jgi:putative flippase GtrA
MTVRAEQPTDRLTRFRQIGGLGAAIAVTPYLLIKIVWTFGFFIPTEEMGGADWRAINAATAFLAAVGIVLAMAFSRPWGERLPAWLVALPVWVGTGLLVPMLLLAPVLGPAAMTRDQDAGSPDFWIYEQILVMISLVGVGVGLPLALAGYAKARWPEALGGPLAYDEPVGGTGALQVTLARLVAAGCVLLACVKVFWAAGGTLGLDPDELDRRDLWWHMLSLSTAVWALAGAWGILVLTARRGTRGFLPPMVAAWVSSGMLFSYSVYNLLTLTDMQQPSPELPIAGALARDVSAVLGVMMGMTLLLVLHDRRRALRTTS